MISKQERAAKLSKKMKEKWSKDKEFKEKLSKKNSEQMTNIWNDPEQRKIRLKAINAVKTDPEYRKKISVTMKKRAAQPEFRENLRIKNTKEYRKPERREEFREIYESHRDEHVGQMKKKWKDPEYVYRVMKSRKGKQRALEILDEKFGLDTRLRFEYPDQKMTKSELYRILINSFGRKMALDMIERKYGYKTRCEVEKLDE